MRVVLTIMIHTYMPVRFGYYEFTGTLINNRTTIRMPGSTLHKETKLRSIYEYLLNFSYIASILPTCTVT